MKKYDVTVEKTGYIQIEANSEEEAMEKAEHMTSNDANWENGFGVTCADEVDYQ